MNTKKIVTLVGVIATLFLGGCVATPYYGSAGYSSGGYYGGSGYYGRTGYGYGYRPAIRSNLYFGGHRHSGYRPSYGGHRHSQGVRGHIGRGNYRGGHSHFGGKHRGGHGGHRGHRGHR
ncbi:MAG: hypothetical protein KDF59_10575 [Nitrosomonas sp.]|nr:hypothetical protein [Nitrosomonas sp.]